MELAKHQKFTLTVASVLAFGIWLFPHWLVHARHPAPGVRNYWYSAGYGFLFVPPRKVGDELRKWANEHEYDLEIGTLVDWRRQFYEWGTLAFLTGFALSGVVVWRRKPANRLGPSPPTLPEYQPQNQSGQEEPQ